MIDVPQGFRKWLWCRGRSTMKKYRSLSSPEEGGAGSRLVSCVSGRASGPGSMRATGLDLVRAAASGAFVAVLVALFLAVLHPTVAHANTPRILHPACHALSAREAFVGGTRFPQFTCSPRPGAIPASDYQHASLWYRIDLSGRDAARDRATGGPVLMVGLSRFDRLVVSYRYADGAVRRQSVQTGAFGGHWRLGGQIVFEAPTRDARLVDMVVRFDRLASASLLRLRLVDKEELNRETSVLGVIVGGALVMLVLGALYNLTLTVTSGQRGSLWQCCWALTMVAWGALWSQLALFLVPGLAGAPSAQACTALSGLAITFATLGAVTALEERHVPRLLRRAALVLGVAVGLGCVPLALLRAGPLPLLGNLLGGLVLLDLLAVAVCLTLGWRRGSREARAYVGAWALPMFVLCLVEVFDFDMHFYGAGSQIVILCAAAWQTLFLSIAISRASGRLRAERDLALHNEAQAHALARIDPLCGLSNRRGFMEAIEPMLAEVNGLAGRDGPGGEAFALLLLDIDRFKAINDTYGHDAGDMALITVAASLRQWESAQCKVARLGGEEFAIALRGRTDFALLRFADEVRRAVEACEHGAQLEGAVVTVSIGIALAAGGASQESAAQVGPASVTFREIYRQADAALYCAKNEGRNKVVLASDRAQGEGLRTANRADAPPGPSAKGAPGGRVPGRKAAGPQS